MNPQMMLDAYLLGLQGRHQKLALRNIRKTEELVTVSLQFLNIGPQCDLQLSIFSWGS